MIESHTLQLDQFEQPHKGGVGFLIHEAAVTPNILSVENGIAELDILAERHDMLPSWPATVVETSNSQVMGGEIEIVDANTAEIPHYNVYLKLHNWAEQFKSLEEKGAVDEDYHWESKLNHGMINEFNGTVQKALVLEHSSSRVSLIYDPERSTFDNLVCITIPKTEGVSLARSEDVEVTINQVLTLLTGTGLDDPSQVPHEADMISAAIEYNQSEHGPLTAEQRQTLHGSISRERVSKTHIAYVDHTEAGTLPEQHKFRHKLKSLHSAEEVIAAGELQSSLQRLKQGDTRSTNRPDIYYGGGDLVYTHIVANESGDTYASAPTFMLSNKLGGRLDVRAYTADAYGQVDRSIQSPIDEAVGRKVIKQGSYAIEARVHPKDIDELRGVHEVDFHNSIAVKDIETIYLPDPFDPENRDPDNSCNDFSWFRIIATSFNERGIDFRDSEPVTAIERNIRELWGNEEAVKNYLIAKLEMGENSATQLVTGMNMDPKSRLIARLHRRGIQDIAGRPLDEVIKYGSTLAELRAAYSSKTET